MPDKSTQTFQYDVCLSFAGEDRSYVHDVAEELRSLGVRVFFDKYEEVGLWGKDLYVHLDDVYKNSARYCVMFVSRHYSAKLWTTHERKSAQERAFKENSEYILPARFDDTPVPGLRDTVGYIDLQSRDPKALASLIAQKVGGNERRHFLPPVPDVLFQELEAKNDAEHSAPKNSHFGIIRMSEQDRNKRLKTAFAAIGTLVASITAIRAWPEIDITSFSVEPLEIKKGERVRLEWNVKNASQVRIIPNIGTVNSIGSRTDAPNETTIYRLVAEKFIFKEEAEFEIVVKTVPDQTRIKKVIVQFSDYNSGFLKGNEFSDQGIQKIEAAPTGNDCQNAKVAILPSGSYRSKYSFLTTASPGELTNCNMVPLAMYFVDPAREITLHFYGANVPYKLEAYGEDGSTIGHETATASPYDYDSDYEIRITSQEANIASIRFGYEKALTMIRDIELIR